MINWNECYKLWREFEGLVLKAYPDPATGNDPWTIGYGHTGGLSEPQVKPGMVITKDQAEEYMKNDLKAAYEALKKLIKVELNENQWAALVSFYGNLKTKTFLKSSVLTYINKGRLDEVPGRMALYRLGDGKVMKGLVRRRTAEGALWMKPVGPDDSLVKQTSTAEPAKTNKPWDWGAFGGLLTLFAGMSDSIKKLVGNFTSTFGVDPIVLILIVGLGFAAWTIYSKYKSK